MNSGTTETSSFSTEMDQEAGDRDEGRYLLHDSSSNNIINAIETTHEGDTRDAGNEQGNNVHHRHATTNPRSRSLPCGSIEASSILLAAFSVILVSSWIHQLGGLSLSWSYPNAIVFNWHPFMMITAFFFMTVASLAFRIEARLDQNHLQRRRTMKRVHTMCWVVAAASATVGICAVVRSHNDPAQPIANLYSFHSWLGVLVLVLYVSQFLVGFLVFYDWLQPWITPSSRASILQMHKAIVGPIVYLCAAATILLGIQEKEGFVGCSFAVTEPDVTPIRHILHNLSRACWTSHFLGVTVVLAAIMTSLSWLFNRQ